MDARTPESAIPGPRPAGRHRLPYVLAAVILAASTWGVLAEYERQRGQNQAHVAIHGGAIALAAERRVDAAARVLVGLKALALSRPDLGQADFGIFARNLAQSLPELRSLQLSPRAVVRYVYPLSGNEAALGLRLLDNPRDAPAAKLAIMTGETVVAGPFVLVQGYQGLVLRMPVFEDELAVPGSRGDSVKGAGARRFWGFATVVLDFGEFVRRAGLDEEVIEIALRGKDASGAEGAFFLGDPGLAPRAVWQTDIDLPSGTWRLYVGADRDQPPPSRVFLLLVPCVLAAALIFALTWRLESGNDRLRREMAARVEREAELSRYERIIAESSDLTALIGRDETCVLANRAVLEAYGLRPEEVVGQDAPSVFVGGERAGAMREALARAFRGEVITREGWYELPRAGRRYLSLDYRPLSEVRGGPRFVALTAHDSTENKELLDRLATLATTDSLTGAATRRVLWERLGNEMARAKRHGQPLSICMLDLDHFKAVNDRYGHDAGDEVLKATAAFCGGSLRAADLFCRFGGEEFVFLLPFDGPREALAFAERIRAGVEGLSVALPEATLRWTASLGVATFDPEDDTPESLLKRVDQALYSAKASGRNRVAGPA